MNETTQTNSEQIRSALEALETMVAAQPPYAFAVRLWDGREVRTPEEPEFIMNVRDTDALRVLAASSDPSRVAEAYVDGGIAVVGDLSAAIETARWLGARVETQVRLQVDTSGHTPHEDTKEVWAHDLSDAFFALFLDERMVYPCGYFTDPADLLERPLAVTVAAP